MAQQARLHVAKLQVQEYVFSAQEEARFLHKLKLQV